MGVNDFTEEEITFIFFSEWHFRQNFDQVIANYKQLFPPKSGSLIVHAFRDEYKEQTQQDCLVRAKQYHWHDSIIEKAPALKFLKDGALNLEQRAYLLVHDRLGVKKDDLAANLRLQFSIPVSTKTVVSELRCLESDRPSVHYLLEQAKKFKWYACNPTHGSPGWKMFNREKVYREGQLKNLIHKRLLALEQPEWSKRGYTEQQAGEAIDRGEEFLKEGAWSSSTSTHKSPSTKKPGAARSLTKPSPSLPSTPRKSALPVSFSDTASSTLSARRRRALPSIDTSTGATNNTNIRRADPRTPFSAVSIRSQSPARSEVSADDDDDEEGEESRSDKRARAMERKYRQRD